MIPLLNVPVPRCLMNRAFGRPDDKGFMSTYQSRTQPKEKPR